MRKRTLVYLGILGILIASMIPVNAETSPLLFKGSLCEDIQYQKSIEAVSISDGKVYAACDYRMVLKGELVSIYYLGSLGAYSLNGSKLWVNDSGYAVKLLPYGDKVIAGSLGGFVIFDGSGRIIGNHPTKYKLYDFESRGNELYAVSGDVWFQENQWSSSGIVTELTIFPNSTMKEEWSLNLTMMPSRIRLGPIIYVGAGFPSGYSAKYQFGGVFGVSYSGEILWNISTGEWVRDMELWGDNIVVGTGTNNTRGHLLILDEKGDVLWNESTFFVEDLLVRGDTLYVAGIEGDTGKVSAYDLREKRKLWEINLPYRAKVLAYIDKKLAVGSGKFESRNEGNVTRIYSEGGLYVLNPETGDTIWSDTSTGYIRSLATEGDVLVAGTGSSNFYVYDVSKISGKKGICGPGILVLLVVILRALGGEIGAKR